MRIRVSGDKADLAFEVVDGLATTERMIQISGNDLLCSDGFHTLDELYRHRHSLFIALCRSISSRDHITDGRPCWCNHHIEATSGGTITVHDHPWRSTRHSDGELCFGDGRWFVLGIGKDPGKQITYHLPIEWWTNTDFAETLEKAPQWDGHTSNDVLVRLAEL